MNSTIYDVFKYLQFYHYYYCYFQISDDDRMSLTTAVSDEEEAAMVGTGVEGAADSPFKTLASSSSVDATTQHLVRGVAPAGFGSRQSSLQGGGTAASFNCTGAVRKAGFLSVKKWLLRKKHQVGHTVQPYHYLLRIFSFSTFCFYQFCK